ncbi:LCP family protein [Varibaculum vaginae]|uniref:LCP family protein n=1 Tax=Varibaculum vaginae TaxID=2364797 RepID=UPI001F210D8F|nr:LCP family protein [Varibaculum vaginae]
MSQSDLPASFPPPKRPRPQRKQQIPPSYSPREKRNRPESSQAGNQVSSSPANNQNTSYTSPTPGGNRVRPAISRKLSSNQAHQKESCTTNAQEIPIQMRTGSRFAGRSAPARTRVLPQKKLDASPEELGTPQTPSRLEPIPPSKERRVPRPNFRVRRILAIGLTLGLIFMIAWPLYLCHLVNSQLNRVDALSALPANEGETWLIAGSDKRSDGSDGGVSGEDVGARTDTIMLIRRVNSMSAIVSLPRDTAVDIPGYGLNKLNAAYSLEGPKLLVQTVESLSGVKVDHYLEVSMGSVTQLVDAVGGIELCLDYDVDDADSALKWQSGCHRADGGTALAFSRMRQQDPKGDIGRAERQRQVVSKLADTLFTPSTFLNPFKQQDLAIAGAQNLTCDNDSGTWALGKLLLTYRNATKNNLTGAPPIADMAYYDGAHGAMVLLDTQKISGFWSAFQKGTLQPSQYHQFQ